MFPLCHHGYNWYSFLNNPGLQNMVYVLKSSEFSVLLIGWSRIKKLDIYYIVLAHYDLCVAEHHDLVVPLHIFEVTYLNAGWHTTCSDICVFFFTPPSIFPFGGWNTFVWWVSILIVLSLSPRRRHLQYLSVGHININIFALQRFQPACCECRWEHAIWHLWRWGSTGLHWRWDGTPWGYSGADRWDKSVNRAAHVERPYADGSRGRGSGSIWPPGGYTCTWCYNSVIVCLFVIP